MNIYITYFYNIRFFPKNLIPVSTAIWDPKWYHESKGNNHIFQDKNGVLNGLRLEQLSPEATGDESCMECSKNHPDVRNNGQPGKCSFIKSYREYLESLNFQEIYEILEYISKKSKEALNLDENPDICLIVYEKPDNPCSERGGLVEWFKENGVELKEWVND